MMVVLSKIGLPTECCSLRSALPMVGTVRPVAVHQPLGKNHAESNRYPQTFDITAKICDSYSARAVELLCRPTQWRTLRSRNGLPPLQL
jgi:hypothetical protein